MCEAFVYLWYDAPNKMYYLGKHKGSPDDTYTHSSTIWESFTKDNIPKGVTRRILAYGTDEEMCILEHELLVNRKKRCWNRYYNESLGDPRYVDQSGENHYNWKGGFRTDYPQEYYTAYDEVRQKTSHRKAWQKEYDEKRKNCPKRKAWRKRYNARKKAETQGEGTLEEFLK